MNKMVCARKTSVLLLITLILTALAACRSTHSAEYFLGRAEKLIQQKQYDRALLELKNAAREQPTNAEAYYQAALAHLGMGQYQAAYFDLTEATKLNPTHVKAQEKLAEMIASSVANATDPQELEEAEKRVHSILEVVPESSDALTALARAEYPLGKPLEAIQHLQRALEKAPQNLQAAWSLATIKAKKGDFNGAEQILRKAAVDSPKSPEAQIALARLLVIANRPEEAESAYRQALHTDPEFAPALQEMAELQLSRGKKDQAERTLAELSALPDKRYRAAHATYLFRQRRQEEALKELEKLAANDPKDHNVFTILTETYLLTNHLPDAERIINRALKKDPKDSIAI